MRTKKAKPKNATKPSYITFTPADVAGFEAAITKARAEGKSMFVWREHEFVLDYATYLLEFLKRQLDLSIL